MTTSEYERIKSEHIIPSGFDIIGMLVNEFQTKGKEAAQTLYTAFLKHEKPARWVSVGICERFQAAIKSSAISH